VREHLYAGLDYQRKLARFMENHDEPRAAATFARPMHEAAAIITYLSPGLRFFHQGQFEGHRKRLSPHLIRAPRETTDEALRQFYERLRAVLMHPVFRDGEWRLLFLGYEIPQFLGRDVGPLVFVADGFDGRRPGVS
jgi:hypothetical protein